MLKQILKSALLKVPRVRQAVADYRRRQKERQYHEHWAKLLKSGGMVR